MNLDFYFDGHVPVCRRAVSGSLDAAGRSNGRVRLSPEETIESASARKQEPISFDVFVNGVCSPQSRLSARVLKPLFFFVYRFTAPSARPCLYRAGQLEARRCATLTAAPGPEEVRGDRPSAHRVSGNSGHSYCSFNG